MVTGGQGRRLDRSFFARDVTVVARDLLGRVLLAHTADGDVAVRLTEVEAYAGQDDPASHAFRGPTVRNAVMFGSAGHLYTYRSHGIHVCANVSCGPEGTAAAVLLRALAIESGLDAAQARRGPAVRPVALARGPGNLCSALAIEMGDNGVDVFDTASPVTVQLGEPGPDSCGPRVGVSRAADRPWRFWLTGRPEVSAYRRSPRAPRPGASD